MGIVERLRETKPLYNQNTGRLMYNVYWNRDGAKAADLIERLRVYADHTPYCQSRIKGLHETPCNCGLSALIKEIEGD